MELINQGPYSATEALNLGLVDVLDYRRRIITDLKKEKGTDNTISFAKYHTTRYRYHIQLLLLLLLF